MFLANAVWHRAARETHIGQSAQLTRATRPRARGRFRAARYTVADTVAGTGLDGLVSSEAKMTQADEIMRESNSVQACVNAALRSAKPLCVGSIPTRASKTFTNIPRTAESAGDMRNNFLTGHRIGPAEQYMRRGHPKKWSA